MNLTPKYKRTVETPKGRGLFVREYFNSFGRKYITVRFFQPQHINNGKGKMMPNPNAGSYKDRSFVASLCTINKGSNILVRFYKFLVSKFNKLH